MATDLYKHFRYAYKKPGKGKIKLYSVWAESESESLRASPEVLEGGWRRYGFLGEVK